MNLPGASWGWLAISMAERPSGIWFQVAVSQRSVKVSRVEAYRVEPLRLSVRPS